MRRTDTGQIVVYTIGVDRPHWWRPGKPSYGVGL